LSSWRNQASAAGGLSCQSYFQTLRLDFRASAFAQIAPTGCHFGLSISIGGPGLKNTLLLCTGGSRAHISFIEFTRDNSTGTAAEIQVAAAGVMALYNRYLLRSEHLHPAEKKELVSDIACLKVYGATFSGCHYTLWCIEPKLAQDETWKGCTMSRIYRGYCDMKEELELLVQWMNEIHAWGVTTHGPACERDLKGCMRVEGVPDIRHWHG
jgi:hypothetical protein